MKKPLFILLFVLTLVLSSAFATNIYSDPKGIHANNGHTTYKVVSDSTDGSTDIVDSSYGGSIKSITVAGDAHHETDQAKSGTTSIYFDGAGDDYSIVYHADINLGPIVDFTIGGWWYPVQVDEGLFGIRIDASNLFRLIITGGGSINIYSPKTGETKLDISSTDAVILNEWNYIEIDRKDQVVMLFLRGVKQPPGSFDNFAFWPNFTTQSFYAGQDGGGFSYTGYQDGFFVKKGIALHDRDFEPPNRENR